MVYVTHQWVTQKFGTLITVSATPSIISLWYEYDQQSALSSNVKCMAVIQQRTYNSQRFTHNWSVTGCILKQIRAPVRSLLLSTSRSRCILAVSGRHSAVLHICRVMHVAQGAPARWTPCYSPTTLKLLSVTVTKMCCMPIVVAMHCRRRVQPPCFNVTPRYVNDVKGMQT